MISFSEYITEARLSLTKEQTAHQAKEIEKAFGPIFKKHFPNGFFEVRESALIGGGAYWVTCGVIGDDVDQTNRNKKNDPLKMTLNVEFPGEGTDNGRMISKNGISIAAKPTNERLVMSFTKIPFRKSSGDLKKLTTAFESTIKRVRAKYDDMLKNDTIFKTDIKDKYKK